jgi:integrase
VRTAAEAIKALERLKVQRDDNELPALRQAPKFSDYVNRYREHLDAMPDKKRPATVAKELRTLRLWSEHLGETRLDRITRAAIIGFMEKRQKSGMSARTVNLDVIALRQCLKLAQDEGWLKTLPTQGMRPMKTSTKQRPLFTTADIEAVCAAAFEPAFVGGRPAKSGERGRPLKNAQQLSDYLRLMAFCGSRRNETLVLRWSDVDFENGHLTVGAEGHSKSRKPRTIDFNSELESHLRAMVRRRQPDSQWLFPSPQRGDKDVPAKSLNESLKLARAQAAKSTPALAMFGFHDCRHHFLSFGVMAGVGFMTLAKWAGHEDGGVLIGKVYGHLADEHRKAMAQKLTFAPRLAVVANE